MVRTIALAFICFVVAGTGRAVVAQQAASPAPPFLTPNPGPPLFFREAWKQTPEFAERFRACAALCEKAKGSDYDRVVTI